MFDSFDEASWQVREDNITLYDYDVSFKIFPNDLYHSRPSFNDMIFYDEMERITFHYKLLHEMDPPKLVLIALRSTSLFEA